MSEPEGDAQATAGNTPDFRRFLRPGGVIPAAVAALAVIFFVAVTALSHIYEAQQEFLGNRWFLRGAADLKKRHFESAVTEFRAALLYSRDSYTYQLNLAEALVGLKRT